MRMTNGYRIGAPDAREKFCLGPRIHFYIARFDQISTVFAVQGCLHGRLSRVDVKMARCYQCAVMDLKLAIFAAIVTFAYFVGATTGFGSAIISLSLAVHLFPMDFVVPVIVPLNVLITLYLAIRHRASIDKKILFTRIIPLSLAGMPFGLLLYHTIDVDRWKWAFGLFVLFISIFELVRIFREKKRTDGPAPLSPLKTFIWLFSGGIVHGLWVSGGPLVAYWAGRNIPAKGEFRSTLMALWLALNVALLFSHLATGNITLESARWSGILLPFLFLGIGAGEWLHPRLPERGFRILVYAVLVFTGAAIVIRGI